jgi:hypothetical protein
MATGYEDLRVLTSFEQLLVIFELAAMETGTRTSA